MGDGYMCGRNVKMKESLSHFCGISFLPKWDFFFAAYTVTFYFGLTHKDLLRNPCQNNQISTFRP